MIALVTVLAGTTIALAVYVIVLRRRLGMLGRRHDRVATTDHHTAHTADAPMIVIQIKNVTEVAVQRTSLARPLATLAPGVLRSIVVRQTIRELRIQMAEEGLDADVDIRHLPVAPPEVNPPAVDPLDA